MCGGNAVCCPGAKIVALGANPYLSAGNAFTRSIIWLSVLCSSELSESHAACAANDDCFFTFVPFHMNSPCEWLVRFVAVIPSKGSGNVCFASSDAPISGPSRACVAVCGLRDVHAGDLDDGLATRHLGWRDRGGAGGAPSQLGRQLFMSRGGELSGGVGSERLMCETMNCLVGVILK